MYNIFKNLELAHAHYETNIMKPPSHSRPQPPPVAPTKSSHSSSKVKAVHLATPIPPSCNYYGNLAHTVSECNIPSEDFFVIIVGKRGIRKLFVLPSSRNGSNFDYHDKICQHLSSPLNHKPRHLSLPLELSSPRVILVRMLRRRSTMLMRGRCFKPMSLKFKLYKRNLNH
jgi:hypothetical protein